MRRLTLLIALLPFAAFGQNDSFPEMAPPLQAPDTGSHEKKEQIFEFAEKIPASKIDLGAFFGEHLKYPKEALENNIQGTVYVRFIVDTNGNISNPQISKGLKDGGHGLNKEALRLVSLLPAGSFTPASMNGKPVNCWVMIPIRFVYEKPQKKKKEGPSGFTYRPASPGTNLDEFFASQVSLPDSVWKELSPGRTVYVEALIDKEGKIDQGSIRIAQSVSPLLDAEAIRLVKLLPSFNPATKNSEAVPEWVKIPVKFGEYVREEE